MVPLYWCKSSSSSTQPVCNHKEPWSPWFQGGLAKNCQQACAKVGGKCSHSGPWPTSISQFITIKNGMYKSSGKKDTDGAAYWHPKRIWTGGYSGNPVIHSSKNSWWRGHGSSRC